LKVNGVCCLLFGVVVSRKQRKAAKAAKELKHEVGMLATFF
jgi:hypothetical protein